MSTALGDVDGDGDLDLVCGNEYTPSALFVTSRPRYKTSAWCSGWLSKTRTVALGDIDGDSDLDLVCGNEGQSSLLYRNTDGIFGIWPAWNSGPANATRGIVLGDVDGDGDLDLVCGNYGESATLYENVGGTFAFDAEVVLGPGECNQ